MINLLDDFNVSSSRLALKMSCGKLVPKKAILSALVSMNWNGLINQFKREDKIYCICYHKIYSGKNEEIRDIWRNV